MPRPSLQNRVIRWDSARWHGAERDDDSINLIVMHATAGASAESSRDWLDRELDTDGKTPLPPKKRCSYHYIIDRDGTIYRHCRPSLVAYHSGDSAWPGPVFYPPGNRRSVNPRSIGIAWANDDEGEKLTELQVESGLWLCLFWIERLHIAPSSVRGHYEVSPGRKLDPRAAIKMATWRDMIAEAA